MIAHGNMPSSRHEITNLIFVCGHFKETCYYDIPAILLLFA